MTEVTTTRARAWALTRADGVVMGFTDHDRDLDFGGISFRAATGMTAAAIMQGTGLSVDNTEAAGALSDSGLREEDILAGLYDGAKLVIWEVDWQATVWRRVLFRGTLGEITRAGGAFKAEMRGLTEPLSRVGGRVFGPLCPAVLGDVRCGVDLDQSAFRAEAILVAVTERGAVLDLPALPAFAEGWFVDGRVQVLDGTAAGASASIRREEHRASGLRLHLWASPGLAPLAGDTVAVIAGCDKRFSTCRLKFVNQANFQGFPHVPGDDWLLATPRSDGSATGGSLTLG